MYNSYDKSNLKFAQFIYDDSNQNDVLCVSGFCFPDKKKAKKMFYIHEIHDFTKY